MSIWRPGDRKTVRYEGGKMAVWRMDKMVVGEGGGVRCQFGKEKVRPQFGGGGVASLFTLEGGNTPSPPGACMGPRTLTSY